MLLVFSDVVNSGQSASKDTGVAKPIGPAMPFSFVGSVYVMHESVKPTSLS